MNIKEHMDAKPQAPLCSRCNKNVSSCGSNAKACLCWKCTDYLVREANHNKKDEA